MGKDSMGKWFDWFSDAVLLVFLSAVMGFGPNIHHVLVPAKIIFILTFGAKFLIKRYKLTSMVTWSIVVLFVSFIVIISADDKDFAFRHAQSVLQALLFANLIMPHIRESKQSFQKFLYIYLLASLFVLLRALFPAPLDLDFTSRVGVTFGVNPYTVGYIFSVAAIICLYLVLQNRLWLYLIPFIVFSMWLLFTGSGEVFILIGVGCALLGVLYQKNLKYALVASLVVVGVLVLVTIACIGGFDAYTPNNYTELLGSVGWFGMLLFYALPLYIVSRGIKQFIKFQNKGPFVLSTALMVTMMFAQMAIITYTEELSNIFIALCYAGIVIDDPNKGLDVFQALAKIFEWIRHPSMIVNHILKFKISRLLPDNIFLSIKYRMSNGTILHLDNPKTYNEKLQWQKIHDRDPLFTKLADKFAVRDFVAEKIGKQYLVPLVGVYANIADIDVVGLPSCFVLKPTHTSGDVLFCRDKATFDWGKAKRLMNSWLSSNYYWYDREWVYKEIKPRIICEEIIKTVDGNPPRDYKIFCFDGEPKMAFVASDRSNGTKFDFFDIAWNRLPLKQHYPNSTYEIPKPIQWNEMIQIAKQLSVGFPQVRVDLYVDADEQILFGELTFFHFSGFEPFEPASYDALLGSWVQLPKEN